MGGSQSFGFVINDADQVAGVSLLGGDGYAAHAFLWSLETGMEDLGDVANGADNHRVYDLNNLGQVVGFAQMLDEPYHPVFWSRETGMVDLGTFGGTIGYALAINDRGQVVGAANTEDEEFRAFLWTLDGGMTDLGTLGTGSFAFDINERGHIVGGNFFDDGGMRPFLWTPEHGMSDLGTVEDLPLQAIQMNERDQVLILRAPGKPETPERSFLWTEDDGLMELVAADGVSPRQAFALNDLGQVVGVGPSIWGGIFVADLWLELRGRARGDGSVRLRLAVNSVAGCRAREPEVCGFGATADAQAVVVTARLPLDAVGFEVVAVSEGCTHDAARHVVTCTAGLLPVDGMLEFDISAVLKTAERERLKSVAWVTSTTSDPEPDNNRDSLLLPVPDLAAVR